MKAAERQEMENADSFGFQCMLKAADLMVISQESKWGEAIKVIHFQKLIVIRENHIRIP